MADEQGFDPCARCGHRRDHHAMRPAPSPETGSPEPDLPTNLGPCTEAGCSCPGFRVCSDLEAAEVPVT
jgi:hypothetical protein